MKRYFLIVIVVLCGVAACLWKAYREERQERLRAERNVAALNTDLEHYAARTGELVTRIAGLELSDKEFRKLLPELHEEIAGLKVKLKNALSVTKVRTEVVYSNRDSIVYVPAGDSLRVFEVDEEFIRARVSVRDCSVIPPAGFKVLSIPNELTAVPAVKYRGWWFWKRPVSVTLDVKCSNPYVQVTEGIFIELKR